MELGSCVDNLPGTGKIRTQFVASQLMGVVICAIRIEPFALLPAEQIVQVPNLQRYQLEPPTTSRHEVGRARPRRPRGPSSDQQNRDTVLDAVGAAAAGREHLIARPRPRRADLDPPGTQDGEQRLVKHCRRAGMVNSVRTAGVNRRYSLPLELKYHAWTARLGNPVGLQRADRWPRVPLSVSRGTTHDASHRHARHASAGSAAVMVAPRQQRHADTLRRRIAALPIHWVTARSTLVIIMRQD